MRFSTLWKIVFHTVEKPAAAGAHPEDRPQGASRMR